MNSYNNRKRAWIDGITVNHILYRAEIPWRMRIRVTFQAEEKKIDTINADDLFQNHNSSTKECPPWAHSTITIRDCASRSSDSSTHQGVSSPDTCRSSQILLPF
eukprot:TRINITY_DN6_c0_g1_i22.p1 TRINITY_DN6_c0_g1~~TRINITY_DN6_c0_g1_i22.p1  ORF type:complete len:104 (-),score=7.74 TRINITY_DN6_c0_g1_i22:67-378(-)